MKGVKDFSNGLYVRNSLIFVEIIKNVRLISDYVIVANIAVIKNVYGRECDEKVSLYISPNFIYLFIC